MKKITHNDIMDMEQYGAVRREKRAELVAIKKNRNVHIGPDAIIIFENFETMWFQIHEMLYVEKGGAEQIEDELRAYNPLIPSGRELVFTFMLEIDDPERRRKILSTLGHIEDHLFLRFGNHSIKALPKEDDIARTTHDGKTSAVHFLYFPFTNDQIHAFKQADTDVIIDITHPYYRHKVLLSENVRKQISGDFD